MKAPMLAEKKQDDVSNIHRRWSFARITPSTLRSSYAMAASNTEVKMPTRRPAASSMPATI